MNECAVCGSEISAYSRYCSNRCRQRAHRARVIADTPWHKIHLDWQVIDDEWTGLWLVCSCEHTEFLGRRPALVDIITVARLHQLVPMS